MELLLESAGEEPREYRKLDSYHKTIRIAISGNIVLTQREVKIIDTPEFQKLRKYRQLGSSYLVYPSANHTRFEHSLGVLLVAQNMINSIINNPKSAKREKSISVQQWRITRLVALLHDIANYPFGHTLEDETHVITSNQDDSERLRSSLSINTSIGRVLKENLSDVDYQLFFDVLTAKSDSEPQNTSTRSYKLISELGANAFIVDIVKNTVCADLIDYLKRDSFFCNIDLLAPDTFLSYLYIHREDGKPSRLAIRLKKQIQEKPRQAIISELVQLLETRYFIAERVYFHHAKQVSSAMIAKSVYHAMNSGKEYKKLTILKLSELGDDELVNELTNDKYNPISCRLAIAYKNRNLYKCIYELNYDDLINNGIKNQQDYLISHFHENPSFRSEIEEKICDLAGIPAGSIVIYCPNSKMNMKTAEMRVFWNDDVIPFHKITAPLAISKINSIKESHIHLWRLLVFTPNEIKNNQTKYQIISALCKMEFEEDDNPLGDSAELALRRIIDDILNEETEEITPLHIPDIISNCQEVYNNRGGPKLTRRLITEEINKFIDPH